MPSVFVGRIINTLTTIRAWRFVQRNVQIARQRSNNGCGEDIKLTFAADGVVYDDNQGSRFVDASQFTDMRVPAMCMGTCLNFIYYMGDVAEPTIDEQFISVKPTRLIAIRFYRQTVASRFVPYSFIAFAENCVWQSFRSDDSSAICNSLTAADTDICANLPYPFARHPESLRNLLQGHRGFSKHPYNLATILGSYFGSVWHLSCSPRLILPT